ncbi:MAG: RluA family pseudouridine synthase [Hydrogenothermaceae bacterium]
MKRFIVKTPKTLKDFVSESLKISKNRAKDIIDSKNVFVNNKRIWIASHQLKSGDVVEIISADYNFPKEENLEIVYEDEYIIAVNKPPFITSDRDYNSLEFKLRIKYKNNDVKAIHRLDKETSGVILFAKGYDIFQEFKKLWEDKSVKKIYLAISYNEADFQLRTIDTDLDGKEAVSTVKLLKKANGFSYFEVSIYTGRKHQIRRHLASIRHPVVGDKTYGPKKIEVGFLKSIKRHMLHAYKLEFIHPFKQIKTTIKADIPVDFKNVLHYLK